MESTLVLWLSEAGFGPTQVMQLLFSLMISILFVQSGLDKVFNWQGEKAYYTDHFKDSILKSTIPMLMPIITVSELAAGFLSAIGVVALVFTGNPDIALLGMIVAALSILQLFFGQRVAKDYAGAATLVPYFLLSMAGLYFYLFA